jgi:EAL domain-containing protein (putative c-di-GMP-specific phosphodiesterase class I)/GGDEF domain-containing protein
MSARPAFLDASPSFARAASQVVGRHSDLFGLIRQQALHPVFQPIASLQDGSLHAHEALIRGPQGTPLHSADSLFRLARAQDARDGQQLVKDVKRLGLSARMLVFEITEHDRVTDMAALSRVVRELRATGAGLALDDFGDGCSSLRLWSELRPDVVKIDKYFSKDIAQHADRLQTLRALKQIADVFDTVLVAEGIETAEDLRVLRDLSIAYGQGYFLGRPAPLPRLHIPEAAGAVLADHRLAVLPELRRSPHLGRLRGLAIHRATPVTPSASNDEVQEIFLAQAELHAVAVVENGRPVAIVNRQSFMQHYAQPYFKEVFGRKSCFLHANHAPRLVELEHDVDELVGILTSQDQRYLADGFIATENGRYVGLGTGEQLVRSVTELRLEAARHANPLTFLPGNIPISQHITRLLDNGAEFVACYADLNDFKPFNDHYGYWRGDEMIRLVAQVLLAHCDAQNDFVGHVGGDDFVVLFQSSDWQPRCERIVSEFGRMACALYDTQARQAGGIEAEGRDGVRRFFGCTSLSIGAVRILRGVYTKAEQVATEAALAKQAAKRSGTGLLVRGG